MGALQLGGTHLLREDSGKPSEIYLWNNTQSSLSATSSTSKGLASSKSRKEGRRNYQGELWMRSFGYEGYLTL